MDFPTLDESYEFTSLFDETVTVFSAFQNRMDFQKSHDSKVDVSQLFSKLDVLNEVSNKLFFAGEHTDSDYRGTVHGAYLSGIREADKIIDL